SRDSAPHRSSPRVPVGAIRKASRIDGTRAGGGRHRARQPRLHAAGATPTRLRVGLRGKREPAGARRRSAWLHAVRRSGERGGECNIPAARVRARVRCRGLPLRRLIQDPYAGALARARFVSGADLLELTRLAATGRPRAQRGGAKLRVQMMENPSMRAPESSSDPTRASRQARGFVFPVLLLYILLLWVAGPLPQWLDYHDFADTRVLGFVPRAGDVLSNLAILAAGLWSASLWHRVGVSRDEGPAFRLLVPGAILPAFGSAYYHWEPSNARLVWDRLPLALLLTAIVSL